MIPPRSTSFPRLGGLCLLLVLALSAGGLAAAQPSTYSIVPADTRVEFSVRHLALATASGTLQVQTATLELDPDDLTTLTASAELDAGSFDTGIGLRDRYMKASVLDVEAFPVISFRSMSVENVRGRRCSLAGELTIRDVTLPITLDVTIEEAGPDAVTLIAFGTLSRGAFSVTWGSDTIVGDTVRIMLDVVARPADAPAITDGAG